MWSTFRGPSMGSLKKHRVDLTGFQAEVWVCQSHFNMLGFSNTHTETCSLSLSAHFPPLFHGEDRVLCHHENL